MKYSYAEYIPAFKALSDETRLQILDMLSCKEMCACDILEKFSISQSTLSYHMKALTESGLVDGVRDGGWVRYTINKEYAEEVRSFLAETTTKDEDCTCDTVEVKAGLAKTKCKKTC